MLTVDYDGRIVEYEFGELDEVQLAYATSIHKSQGSEYPAVVIPLAMQHYTLLERNLIYTAVTRGKKLVTVDRRFCEHAEGRGARYFLGRQPLKSVCPEKDHNRSSVSKRESMSRAEKLTFAAQFS